MPIWSATPVTDLPEDELSDWAVFDLPNGDRHLAGWSCGAGEGRATSAVQQFDVEQLRAVTKSGRVYQLRGQPGLHPDAEHTWRLWCRVNSVNPNMCNNVSRELLSNSRQSS